MRESYSCTYTFVKVEFNFMDNSVWTLGTIPRVGAQILINSRSSSYLVNVRLFVRHKSQQSPSRKSLPANTSSHFVRRILHRDHLHCVGKRTHGTPYTCEQEHCYPRKIEQYPHIRLSSVHSSDTICKDSGHLLKRLAF